MIAFGRRLPFGALCLVLLGAPGCGDDDAGTAGVVVLECSGSCSCDDQTRACSCAGGTECTLSGESDVTLTCDGNASCILACGEQCDVVCPGTTGCSAAAGVGASFECQGTASCDFTCQADCTVSCSGRAQCLVICADETTCNLDECRDATRCADGFFACGRDCP